MRITKLDGLRGVFSLMVAFFHYSDKLIPDYIYNFFFLRQSYTFVDFFFVLSGFVIAYNYSNFSTIKDLFIFFKKRFIRIYPLLFYSVMVCCLFDIIANNFFIEYVYNPITNNIILFKTLDSLLLLNSTPLLGNSMGMNEPSWSISAEMISYLIFGIISFIFYKKNKIISVLMLVSISSVFLFLQGDIFKIGDYGFVRGILSFNLGFLVYFLTKLKFSFKSYHELFLPVFLIIFFFILNNDSKLLFQFIIPIYFATVVLILVKTNGLLTRFLNLNFFQFLGKISYSIYLNHLIVIIIVPRTFFDIFNLNKNEFNQILVFIITFILLIFYSYFTHKFVETRFGNYLKNIFLSK